MKLISTIAALILLSIAYIAIGILTYDFFNPLEHANNPNTAITGFFWPVTWVMWGCFKLATNYSLAVVISLFLLAGFYPGARLVSKITAKWVAYTGIKNHRQKLLRERKKQESLHDKELDEYLKANGVNLYGEGPNGEKAEFI